MRSGESSNEEGLGVIGVLIFVYENIVEAVLEGLFGDLHVVMVAEKGDCV